MSLNSLDPRVNRLPQVKSEVSESKLPLDQLGTFEVFVQPKEGKPFQHEGAVHAADLEFAYVSAKETFTRRFTCVSIFVADTRDVIVSAMTEGTTNAYDEVTDTFGESGIKKTFEIFHLNKRGKQHIHAGAVYATDAAHAFSEAKKIFGAKQVYNIWAIDKSVIRFTAQEDTDLWKTLPEKKFRDASDYKGGDKLKEFLERTQAK
jgi:ring-1,2-phenylacetyl-CoA epoxidase subunit PaaB